MEKIVEDAIKAVVAIIIGIFVIISLKEFLVGVILVTVGIVIIGANENIRNLLLSFIKFLWDKVAGKETQRMESSPGGIQQQAKRDAIVGKIVSTGIQNIIINQKSEDYDKKMALKTIYKKMIIPLRLLNLAVNTGLKNKQEFEDIKKAIEDFITTKIENELELDDELKNKLNEVMAAFRFTSHELFIKIKENKLNEGLKGLNSFNFVTKCEEATEEIKKKLK